MAIKQKSDKPNRSRESIKECFELEYRLIGELRQLLTKKNTKQTRELLLSILDRLLSNLSTQMEVSCDQGYMSNVLEQCPNLHRKIEALCRANSDCILEIEMLRNRIDQDQPFANIADEVSDDLRQWIQSLNTIRRQESGLLQEAFTVDIGGEA